MSPCVTVDGVDEVLLKCLCQGFTVSLAAVVADAEEESFFAPALARFHGGNRDEELLSVWSTMAILVTAVPGAPPPDGEGSAAGSPIVRGTVNGGSAASDAPASWSFVVLDGQSESVELLFLSLGMSS